jgi:hypothetical protein
MSSHLEETSFVLIVQQGRRVNASFTQADDAEATEAEDASDEMRMRMLPWRKIVHWLVPITFRTAPPSRDQKCKRQ